MTRPPGCTAPHRCKQGPRWPLPLAIALLALLAAPRLALAADTYLAFEDSVNVGAIKWGALALGVLIVVAAIRYLVVTQLRQRRSGDGPQETQESPEEDFRSRAHELGFHGAEYKNLKRIASRLAPKTPGALLVSTTGREYLVADMQRRALRREREIAVLEGIRERLSRLGDQPVLEREVVRLDSQLPVWVEARRAAPERTPTPSGHVPPPAEAPAEPATPVDEPSEDTGNPPAESADEDVEVLPGFDDLASVQGQLIDLGLGGCAVEVDLEVTPGQIVEIWSADWEIYLPRTSGDVVSVEPAAGGRPGILHIHFLDPNQDELTAACEEIRERDEDSTRRRDEGEPESDESGAFGDPAD